MLITGASSGIGRQAAFDFAKNNAQTVIIVSRSKSNLEDLENDLKNNYNSEIIAYPCDVSKKIDVEKMGKFLLDNLDMLIFW